MKVKKILTSCLLAIMLFISSVTLFACGNKATSESVYKAFNEMFLIFREDSKIFRTNTLFNINSSYYIDELCYKTSSNEKVYAYTVQNCISAISLNFISKYYGFLQNYDGKASVKELGSDVEDMSDEYFEMKGEQDRLLALPNGGTHGANYVVYNGHFARFRVEFNDFVAASYKTAKALATFIDEAGLISSVGSDEVKQEELEIYVDIQKLNIAADYERFFFDSCNGLNVECSEFQSAINGFTHATGNMISKNIKSLTSDQAKSLKSLFEKIDNSRGDYQQAIDGFSFHEYVKMDSSLDAYLKEEDNAEAYYNKICDYLWGQQGIVSQIVKYFGTNVVA